MVRTNWQERCKAAGKELMVVAEPGCPRAIKTDVELVQQIIGNLIDNACKYSRDAADGHIWLRAPAGRQMDFARSRGPRARCTGPENGAASSEHSVAAGPPT